jgi:hypothetical protein
MPEPYVAHDRNVEDALAEFDLSTADVHDHVIRAALLAADNVSPLSPPGAGGRHAHDASVAALRGLLLPRGWVEVQHDNVARTVHRERGIAIIVASGNEFTGVANGANHLTTAWPKGSAAFAGAIIPIQDGLDAVDGSGFDWGMDEAADVEWTVYYLLYHRADDEVRVELSAPSRIDDSGFPRGWASRRIMLSPYLTQQFYSDDDEGDSGPEEVDVPVTAR